MATKLHDECMKLAEDLIANHCTEWEGERYFNLGSYLDELDYKLQTSFAKMTFRMETYQVARFLWCCISEDPYANTFREMAVLD